MKVPARLRCATPLTSSPPQFSSFCASTPSCVACTACVSDSRPTPVQERHHVLGIVWEHHPKTDGDGRENLTQNLRSAASSFWLWPLRTCRAAVSDSFSSSSTSNRPSACCCAPDNDWCAVCPPSDPMSTSTRAARAPPSQMGSGALRGLDGRRNPIRCSFPRRSSAMAVD